MATAGTNDSHQQQQQQQQQSNYQSFPPSEEEAAPPHVGKYFKLFPYLHPELQVTILSFIAYAPFETMPEHYPKSPLTDELPMISRRFRTMCNSDILWKDAVIRIAKKEPRLWRAALKDLCINSSSTSSSKSYRDETIAHLVERTHRSVQGKRCGDNKCVYKFIYEQVVTWYLRFKGPVFIMPGQVALGQSYALHFFEHRYRLLIAELMRGQPASALNGGPIDCTSSQKQVCFIHANRNLDYAAPAVLVQVVQCQIYGDGSADVVLLPIHFVWLERIWVRPNSSSLYYAQCLKMGHVITTQMNHLQRQEALATAMDRVHLDLMEAQDDDDMYDDDSEDSDYIDNDYVQDQANGNDNNNDDTTLLGD